MGDRTTWNFYSAGHLVLVRQTEWSEFVRTVGNVLGGADGLA